MSSWKRLLLIFAITIALIPVLPARAQRALPDDNLAYPVLITFKGSTGSGFFLNTHEAVFLVTAKHVLFDPDTQKLRENQVELLSYSKDPSDNENNVIVLNPEILQSTSAIKAHNSQDVAVVKIGTIKDEEESSNDIQELKKKITVPILGVAFIKTAKLGIVGVDLDNVKTLDQTLIGNDVIVFGYPTSLGLQAKPQLDPHRPLLRKGIVAGQNLQRKAIVLDCPVYQGNSGGPVI
jgi:S1-C subfamily serine protease